MIKLLSIFLLSVSVCHSNTPKDVAEEYDAIKCSEYKNTPAEELKDMVFVKCYLEAKHGFDNLAEEQ